MQTVPVKRLRTEAAAEYLGISPSTLQKYRVYGGGPKYLKIGAKVVVYDVAELDAWVTRGTAASTSDPGARALRPRTSSKPRHLKKVLAVAP